MKAIVLVARGLQPARWAATAIAWIDTPALDVLAAEGVVFDQHFADNADPAGAATCLALGPLSVAAETPPRRRNRSRICSLPCGNKEFTPA